MKLLKSFILLLALCAGLLAHAQSSTKTESALAGVWELVTVKSISADSVITYPYGEHPDGNMLLNADGNYSVQIYSKGRTKIASGNKNTATPEENIMMVKGSNSHYGKYEVDTKGKIILFRPEHAFFPNWEGQNLKQSFVLEGNVLTYTSGVSTFGASRSVVSWRKK